jgi:8-oxo-dGTP pyrophosphatase MutT (NUDIX family)
MAARATLVPSPAVTGIPTPRPAATVLLLRDRPDGLFEVFMVQRSNKSSFMPGAHVFPGGAVDPEDHDHPGDLSAEEAADRFGGALDGRTALAHLVAAAREVHEEVGVELPDLAGLRVFARWITPEIESRRFDAWFLAIRLPEGATPVHDDYETVASSWIEPRDALQRYGDGELILAPPTFVTLWELARLAGAEDVLEHAAARVVVPIQPIFRRIDGANVVLLPGDPLYPSEHPVDGPTRIVMGQGRWWMVDRPKEA